MKLVTFEVRTVLGRFQRVGLYLMHPEFPAQGIVDLTAAHAWLLGEEGHENPVHWANFLTPSEMCAFLEMGEPAMTAARKVEAAFLELMLVESESLLGLNDERLIYRPSDVQLKCPVPKPPMLRDFLSFEAHAAVGFKRRGEEVNEAWYQMPVYYKGNPHAMLGPDEPVQWPHYTRRFDYELELACIIGKQGRNIPVEKAHEYIAGYAVMNDFSARDIQKGEMACRLGPAKAKDFATAVGPYLVTPDEAGDVRNLRMTAKINGELWSDGNSGTSHWTFEQMIAHVSMEETIYPGDILGSGTVGGGCGWELDRWPEPGAVMELEIENLGVLRNRVIKPTV